ncbi:hypothetical protein AYK26_06065 [Euryarchaeota archaeon SM23-78]|nr:MAG: hypothetical protein AYK26_06065 [Euryarchaeota archaeon SM23-78]MBW3000569.1 A24 family peptidase [Candidatus Woesearchaeota archaeon]
MLNLIIINLVIGFVALAGASLFDIKTREVPDWLNYGLIAFAIGSSLILSIFHGYYHIIINTFIGLGIGLVIGLLMFYTGQWGGGDSKLIIGLSALIGFSISDLGSGFPALVLFFINILLIGAVYGLLFSFVKALIYFKDFKQEFEKKMRTKQILVIRIIILVIGIGAFIFFLSTKSIESIILFSFIIALFIFLYIWAFVSCVEKISMIRKIKVKDLTEGDWIVKDVVKKNKVILKPVRTGITLKQIALLKKHRIRQVTVKIGVPFVPSFLIAYVLTFLLGNWLIYII